MVNFWTHFPRPVLTLFVAISFPSELTVFIVLLLIGKLAFVYASELFFSDLIFNIVIYFVWSFNFHVNENLCRNISYKCNQHVI